MTQGQLSGLRYLAQAGRSLHMLLTLLRPNRLRSVLATLGVFLGAMLLTLILHVLEAVNIMLEAEAVRLGSHVVTLTATPVNFVRKSSVHADKGSEADTSLSETAGSAKQPSEETTEEEQLLVQSLGSGADESWRTDHAPKSATLTPVDIRVLDEEILQIHAAAPFVLVSGQVANGTILGNCQLLGTTPDFPGLRHFFPARGRFFTHAELDSRARVCLLGHTLAKRLFGAGQKALGRTVTVDKTTLTVIGVMEEKGMDPSGLRLDEFLITPLSTFCQRIAKQDHVSGAWLGLTSRENLPQLERDILHILKRRHHLRDGHQCPEAHPYLGAHRLRALLCHWYPWHSLHHDSACALPQAGNRSAPRCGGHKKKDHGAICCRGGLFLHCRRPARSCHGASLVRAHCPLRHPARLLQRKDHLKRTSSLHPVRHLGRILACLEGCAHGCPANPQGPLSPSVRTKGP